MPDPSERMKQVNHELTQCVDQVATACGEAGFPPDGNIVGAVKQMAAEVTRLSLVAVGYEKATTLNAQALEVICESRDRLKHRVRELEAEVEALKQRLDGFAARIAEQSELLSRRAGKDAVPRGESP